MKIIFLCSSLEPGRDGVGDYTRRLAGELIRQKHQVSIIALNDHPLVEPVLEGTQQDEEQSIAILRLSSRLSWMDRVQRANASIEAINPDWISLQYVSFAFHNKGLPFGLACILKQLCGGRPLHIMFHELWVGREPGSNWKRIVYSVIQKKLIIQLIKSLKPLFIHTHLPYYYIQLEKLGQKVKILPLFSNIIPVNYSNKNERTNVLKIGIFSQIESSKCITDFIVSLTRQAESTGQSVEILLFGGNEVRMRSLRDKLKELGGHISYTGFLDPQNVSLAIQSCTIGLTSVPRHGLGKSGSVAAFLTHGIPVAAPNVLPNFDPEQIGFFSDNLKSSIILTPTINSIPHAKKAAMDAKDSIELSLIASTYLSDLLNFKYE